MANMETTVADFEQQNPQIFKIKSSPFWFEQSATTFEEEEKVEHNVRLGFSLCGTQSAGVFVRKIFWENGGQLKVGDKIIRVNGKSLAGYGPDQLARMLRYVLATSGDSTTLTIWRSKPHRIPTIKDMTSSVSEGQSLHRRGRCRSSKMGEIFDMPETSIGTPMTTLVTGDQRGGGSGGDGLFRLLFKRQMTDKADGKKCGKFSPQMFQRRSISYSPLKYSRFVMKDEYCSNNGFSNTAYDTEPNPDFLLDDDRKENLNRRPKLLPMKMVNSNVGKAVIHKKTRNDSSYEELPLINFDRLGRPTPLISSPNQ